MPLSDHTAELSANLDAVRQQSLESRNAESGQSDVVATSQNITVLFEISAVNTYRY